LTERRYDAVVFDLLTALLDSWTLWNAAAGSPEAGLRWRRKYLELTYGQGVYRPYEDIVRAAAEQSGVGLHCADELVRRWDELPPWPERLPYVAALVDLEEGPRLMSNVVECEFDVLEGGMALEVVFEQVSDDPLVTLPRFRPAQA